MIVYLSIVLLVLLELRFPCDYNDRKWAELVRTGLYRYIP